MITMVDNWESEGGALIEQKRPRTDTCPVCGGCEAEDQLRESDERHLQTLNDREEACRLLTGMLDAFDERWTAEKRLPPIYYKAQRFLDRMLPERLAGNR